MDRLDYARCPSVFEIRIFSKKLPKIKLTKIVAGAAFERFWDGHFVRPIMRAVLAFLRFAFVNV